MNWSVQEIPALRGYTVEWAEHGNYYLSHRNVLYHSVDLKPPFKQIAVVAAPSWKELASNFRLGQRLLRFMMTNVVPLSNGEIFVTFDKTVGVIRNGSYISLGGLVRPCRVLRSACAIDIKGDIYFGEYLGNDERGEMRIYRYRPGTDSLEIAYTFPPNSIKHIHGIYADPFDDSLLCLTGDDLSECRMIRTSDGFQSTETVGDGDETWRAVSILFDKDAMYYGMDAEFRANHIYRLDRATSERQSLGEVNGTVFYSKQLGGDRFFATTAENAPSQTENVAALWNVTDAGELLEVAKFHKDRWHGTLFMFGTIHFPYANKVADKLFFSLVGVREDNRTFIVSTS
ncbi:MAG TPA: hypothetical protein VJV05_14625 [Pyrinomonadaceae bacterium]|nr:hypothetical protein [Pyrinomonadaceae bacterium]